MQHSFGIATEIGAGHGDNVGFAPVHELMDMITQLVVRVGGDVVELVHGDETVVEGFHSETVQRKTEGGVGADERLVSALQETFDRSYLTTIVRSRRVAEVPLGLDLPVRPEAELAERLVVEAGPDGPFRHHDDSLFELLVGQFVQCDEHERAAFAGCRGRFDEQVLLAALLVSALLHWAHSESIGASGTAILRVVDGDGGNENGGVHASEATVLRAVGFLMTACRAIICV